MWVSVIIAYYGAIQAAGASNHTVYTEDEIFEREQLVHKQKIKNELNQIMSNNRIGLWIMLALIAAITWECF